MTKIDFGALCIKPYILTREERWILATPLIAEARASVRHSTVKNWERQHLVQHSNQGQNQAWFSLSDHSSLHTVQETDIFSIMWMIGFSIDFFQVNFDMDLFNSVS